MVYNRLTEGWMSGLNQRFTKPPAARPASSNLAPSAAHHTYTTIGYTICMPRTKKFLLYVTNNEAASRHEVAFDVAFFIINTIAAIVGIALFLYYNEAQWIPILIIEYTWALDTIRHNRE